MFVFTNKWFDFKKILIEEEFFIYLLDTARYSSYGFNKVSLYLSSYAPFKGNSH